MKFIPLTQHYQTVALIYEKCADISKQIDALTQQQKQNGQVENEDTQQQVKMIHTFQEQENLQSNKNPLDSQIQQQEEVMSFEKQDIKNDQNILKEKQIKQKKFGKKIVKKQQKQKVQVKCDHCDKVFETEKLYQKHQYQLMSRKKSQKKRLTKQTNDIIQNEGKKQKLSKTRKLKNKQQQFDSIEICL